MFISASYVNKGNKEPVVQRYSFQSEKLQAGAKDPCDPYLHRQKNDNKNSSKYKRNYRMVFPKCKPDCKFKELSNLPYSSCKQ